MTSLDKTPGIGAPRQAPPPQELELLREEINAFDEKRRLDAVRRLGALHDTRAVPDLVGRMHIDSSPAVRKAAIEALYAINDPQGWPEIAKVLGIDASPDVRIKAVEILALSSDQTQMTAIVRALKDNNQAVRLKAAELLGTTGDRGQANALVNALQDESRQVRQQAAISIGKLQNVSVVPHLIAGLAQADGTRNANFETDHIEALVQLGSQASAKGAVARGIADSAKACSVPSGGYQPDRVSGSFVLQAVTLERYQRTSYELTSFYENRISILAHLQSVEFSYSDPPPVLVVVTRAMARIKDPTYVDALCRIALQYSEPALRWLALCSLQDLRATNAGDTLQKVLQDDDDWIVRKKVAEVLGELRISAAGDLLCRKALSDSNQFVRHQSIRTLGQLEIVTAIPTLSEVVRRSSDDLARVLAVGALGQIKSEQAVSPLASALGADKNLAVQEEAATALGTIGYESALPFLIQVMQDQERPARIRVAAAGSAAKFGDDRAVDALCDMMTSQDFSIRKTAVRLLADIDTEKSTKCIAKVFAEKPRGTYHYQFDGNDLQHLAISALANRRSPTAKKYLGDVICAKPHQFDHYVTERAIDALIVIDQEAALDQLRRALFADVNAKAVAQALARLGSNEAGVVLLRMLRVGRSDDTRVECVTALGAMKYRPSYKYLQELAGTKKSDLYESRSAARRALNTLDIIGN